MSKEGSSPHPDDAAAKRVDVRTFSLVAINRLEGKKKKMEVCTSLKETDQEKIKRAERRQDFVGIAGTDERIHFPSPVDTYSLSRDKCLLPSCYFVAHIACLEGTSQLNAPS
jgi:hypothetical protein